MSPLHRSASAMAFWVVGVVVLLFSIRGSSCLLRESTSLLQFKASVDDPSGRLQSWTAFNCCQWEGVRCHPRTGHVISLHLLNAGDYQSALRSSSGDVISPLCDLQRLQRLDLSGNKFYGVAISPCLGRLKRLHYLDLSHAGFTGALPNELGNMSSLEFLDLSSNDFDGVAISPCLGRLKRLYYLDLSVAWFTGALPNEFGNMSSLQHLDLRFNYIGGAISPCLGRLKRLQYLDLSDAGFTGAVPNELGNMSSLQYLDLSSRDYRRYLRIANMRMWSGNLKHLRELLLDNVDMSEVASDDWGAAFSSMLNLTLIQMSGCGLSGAIPSSLGNLTHLIHLDLGGNSLDSVPPSLSNLSNLVSLLINNNRLNGSIPSGLLRLPRLQQINLSYNDYLEGLEGALSPILPHHSASLKSIDISYTKIGGAVPDSIGNISSLTQLRLKDCVIGGRVPSTTANLLRLVSLDLSRNKLEGTIFSTIANLSRLEYLDLSGNKLEGTSTTVNLSRLVYLDLSGNKLEGSIFPMVESPELQIVHLQGNKFDGNVPHTILKLFKLTSLDLSSNRLTGRFSGAHLGNLSRLKELVISDNLLTVTFSSSWIPSMSLEKLSLKSCNMTGELPAFLVTQYDITWLDLSNNSLIGTIPLWIWDPHALNLFYLNLSHNQFDGHLPNSLAGSTVDYVDLHRNSLQGSIPLRLPPCRLLDLSENQFNSSIPVQIGKYSFLYYFYISLSHNNLSGRIPDSICRLVGAVLILSHNKLTGKIPWSCRNSNLEVLNLENNYLEDELSLGFMPYLEVLKLGGNRLYGSIPSSLANCTVLKILDLGENNMTGKLPNWIEKLSHLRILILKSNRLEGKIPSQVTKLSFLQILDLSSNNFSGNIPKSISNFHAMVKDSTHQDWEAFKYYLNNSFWYTADSVIRNKGQEMEYDIILGLVKSIDLSNNKLTGTIPHEMGLLKGLMILNISRNQISGEIPASLGNMTTLESFDVSQNHLSGMIPSELQSLTFLAVLNVSHNNLSGRIPQGNQFATYLDPSAFSNNPGLCGPQINKSCTPDTNSSPIEDVEGKGEEEGVWWGVAVGLSYGVAFGVVMAVMCLNKRCVQWMDNIIIRLF